MTTRAEFLDRIRRRTAAGRERGEGRVAERPADPAGAVELIRRQLSERWPETLERFRLEFEAVGGAFHRAPGPDAVPEVMGCLARERRARRVITWHPEALGADWSEALRGAGLIVDAMPAGELVDERARPSLRRLIADAEIGLTGADLAVAETGSLVLIAGRGRPRTTSLLPPCHVAVFGRGALVESLAQAGVFFEAWHRGAVPAWAGGVINVITGPSRTADIELTLTRGVHGPKELHAIFIDDDAPGGEERHD
jgi:L-lactate dehydrogenase complex protein LldG